MQTYVGRFAPSPTGPLHFGSLVAAVASYLDAKSNGGKWLLRIEDLDKPREVKGAALSIINTLAAFGFVWDGDIIYQSQRHAYYEHYLNILITQHRAYPCSCSRREIADSSSQTGVEGIIYPGTCRNTTIHANKPYAWRMPVTDKTICFNDMRLGLIQHQLKHDIGDFVLKRADGLFTYQLAVVVDDFLQGVTHVVRGEDLLNSTTRQIFLQQALNFTKPCYLHIAVVKNDQGEKLSKQTLAHAIHTDNIVDTLFRALVFLQLSPPNALLKSNPDILWQWAFEHWQSNAINFHK